jgi:hypothetical protein
MRMPTLALASLVLASQVGCGRAPTFDRVPPPPSEEIRAGLGRVVVRSDSDLLAESVLQPAVSRNCSAAALGCLVGIGVGLAVAAEVLRPLGSLRGGGGGGVEVFILAIFLFVAACVAGVGIAFGILGGTVWGLSQGPSGRELEQARGLIEKAVLARRLTDQIKARVVDRAARDTDARVASWDPAAERDTILEISGPRVVLHGSWSFSSPLVLTSEIDVRLIRSRDGAVLHSFRLGSVGGKKGFDEWVGKDGSPVARELGDPDAFAARIVDEIFLLVELPAGARR